MKKKQRKYLSLIILLWIVPLVFSCKTIQPTSSFKSSDKPRRLLSNSIFKPKYLPNNKVEILEKGGFLGPDLEFIWHRTDEKPIHFPVGKYSLYVMDRNDPIVNDSAQNIAGIDIWNRYMGKIIEDFQIEPSFFLFSIPGVIFACVQEGDYRSQEMFMPNAMLNQKYLKEGKDPYKPLPNNLSQLGNDEVLRLVYFDLPNQRLLMLDRMYLKNNRTLVVVYIYQSIHSSLDNYDATSIRTNAYATTQDDLPVAYRLATQRFTKLSLQIQNSTTGNLEPDLTDTYNNQIKIQ